MERIGVDPAGIHIMAPKQIHYNIKVGGLTPAQANVIKQDMLSIGGEAAVAAGVVSCSVRSSDAILSGTLKQFNTLVDKLKRQSFGLSAISRLIERAIENSRLRRYVVTGRSGAEWALGGRTRIMGILNVTPDSFSDGGEYLDASAAVRRGVEMAGQGADWIDVGGESTRPGSVPVEAQEEMDRVAPVVEALAGEGLAVSVDTTKALVADAALKAGAEMINDVSGLGADPDMAGVCAAHASPVVLMHSRGTPADMQKDTRYGDLLSEVYISLSESVERAADAGIGRDKIIVDPGLGFGKSMEGNLELVGRLSEFRSLGLPILVGASRKSFIGSVTGAAVEERLPGSLAVAVISILNGASVLRVHDVREAREAAAMADAVRDAGARRVDKDR
ncbi:MAG: dihydropteroate synthase [Thermodesulfobacteriota bacterium]|nr:MAG: dihydropteroate synthase [Thermodesulfobacteriota bacterium]